MKETLASKIEAMQKRMMTNAAGARRRAYETSALKRPPTPTGARTGAASADPAVPAPDATAKP